MYSFILLVRIHILFLNGGNHYMFLGSNCAVFSLWKPLQGLRGLWTCLHHSLSTFFWHNKMFYVYLVFLQPHPWNKPISQEPWIFLVDNLFGNWNLIAHCWSRPWERKELGSICTHTHTHKHTPHLHLCLFLYHLFIHIENCKFMSESPIQIQYYSFVHFHVCNSFSDSEKPYSDCPQMLFHG